MSCFAWNQGQKIDVSSKWFQCSNSKNCCANGDICLPHGMCYSFAGAQNKVDYYPAGCQVNSFPSPDCPSWCTHEVAQSAVQWNSGNNTWSCCARNGVGAFDCTHTVDTPFGGNGPQDPLSRPAYDQMINDAKKLGVGVIVGIVIAGIFFLGMLGLLIFCCCCSRRARDRRARGKFVPLGSGRDVQSDQVVWNSNVHDQTELHEGPMGGYAAPPHGPGSHGAPQYTVQGFR